MMTTIYHDAEFLSAWKVLHEYATDVAKRAGIIVTEDEWRTMRERLAASILEHRT